MQAISFNLISSVPFVSTLMLSILISFGFKKVQINPNFLYLLPLCYAPVWGSCGVCPFPIDLGLGLNTSSLKG